MKKERIWRKKLLDIISEYQSENHLASRRFQATELYLEPVDTRKEQAYPLDVNKICE